MAMTGEGKGMNRFQDNLGRKPTCMLGCSKDPRSLGKFLISRGLCLLCLDSENSILVKIERRNNSFPPSHVHEKAECPGTADFSFELFSLRGKHASCQ